MPRDLLPAGVQLPGDLPLVMSAGAERDRPGSSGSLKSFTEEQLEAIERRSGDLFLDAGAGSGKTSVLVERFVRAVLEDGVGVGAILTITFTEKAAAEMREKIRLRLRELGADDAARATEGAFISTIHSFCARVLRTHALAAGIDPAFSVLDADDAEALAAAAFADALEELTQQAPGGVDFVAGYGAGPLRGSILTTCGELRSRGDAHPTIPSLPAPPDLDELREELEWAWSAVARELGAIDHPGPKVLQALDTLDGCVEVISAPDPWPGDVDDLSLPSGNGAALATPACAHYGDALAAFRTACTERRAAAARDLLDRLLRSYGARYEQRKRACSSLDFEDLELMCRDLLASNPEVRERYRARFEHVMVDELQDTNQVQLAVIESVARGNLFTVGDAQQSIYGFRHADVELFERRGEQLERVGARATLQTNFRARQEILDVINRGFAGELGGRFRPLHAGRSEPPAADPRVELLIADKEGEWSSDDLVAPWRVAEARALAGRIGALIDDGAACSDVVLLTRATTDLRAYERALEDRGIPTYMIGGRGYWSHPQIVDLVAYLAALANPRDEEALFTVLASPLVGISADALVLLVAAARACGRDPWWLLCEPDGRLQELGDADREKLSRFADWFAGERGIVARGGVDELIDRVLDLTGYDLVVLAMPGGRRRLANVRKLMRLAYEHEAANGHNLRGFVDLARRRSAGVGGGDPAESEAPVEGEALDAVRLMTIHRAKGLEFQIVCVADLGRGPRIYPELVRVGRDGRIGLRLARPGTEKWVPALDYQPLQEQRGRTEAREERRLFYVAMTRAKERLILSGAARLDPWPAPDPAASRRPGSPIEWIAPALVPDIADRVADRTGTTDAGVGFAFVFPPDLEEQGPQATDGGHPCPSQATVEAPPPPPPPAVAPPVQRLSYSSLAEYQRCGYRFYVERVLGVPPAEPSAPRGGPPTPGLGGTERGIVIHALLERLDFRRPVVPTEDAIVAAAKRAVGTTVGSDQAAELAAVIEAFATSELCERLARATQVRREERFGFLLGGVLVEGVRDVIARGPGGEALVVDYKTDRLDGADPVELVRDHYETQRLIYALAALRAGAAQAEVVHTFLEAPGDPVRAEFSRDQQDQLERRLSDVIEGVLTRRFTVSDSPHRTLCGGCPAEGGLCSWPVQLTRREHADRLF